MQIELQCRCGQLRARLDSDRAYAHARCYCKDCRAYALWLGADDILDAQGGTALVATPPQALRFTAGLDALTCLSLSENGLLRWYADCCGMPLANTTRDSQMAYVSVMSGSMQADAREAAFGAPHCVVNAGSATGPVRATPVATTLTAARIGVGVIAARLRGVRNRVFFRADGAPMRVPHVVEAPRD
ncbi:hypothetical protein CNR27_10685 [Luteimonas chenhongjianii]|uniref:CENP-V/GFA domain-containing protein n=1 Tax=Luteimonas chenhongjianii TaxID=2006110 RepID=A0A290XFC1_9GAMM|nr:DUF6151 family protein [Luteimonas chenhongjianii]ATD67835.1 hypothetical protein CNR27_10685 [Luteimonas chenhongjianii]